MNNKEKICMKLIEIGRRIDADYKEGLITKNKRGRLKTQLKEFWDLWYNKYVPVSPSIKEGYNLLWTNSKKEQEK